MMKAHSVIGQLQAIQKLLQNGGKVIESSSNHKLQDVTKDAIVKYSKVVKTEWILGKDAAELLNVPTTLFCKNMNFWSDLGIVECDRSVNRKFKWRFTEKGIKVVKDRKKELKENVKR